MLESQQVRAGWAVSPKMTTTFLLPLHSLIRSFTHLFIRSFIHSIQCILTTCRVPVPSSVLGPQG